MFEQGFDVLPATLVPHPPPPVNMQSTNTAAHLEVAGAGVIDSGSSSGGSSSGGGGGSNPPGGGGQSTTVAGKLGNEPVGVSAATGFVLQQIQQTPLQLSNGKYFALSRLRLSASVALFWVLRRQFGGQVVLVVEQSAGLSALRPEQTVSALSRVPCLRVASSQLLSAFLRWLVVGTVSGWVALVARAIRAHSLSVFLSKCSLVHRPSRVVCEAFKQHKEVGRSKGAKRRGRSSRPSEHLHSNGKEENELRIPRPFFCSVRPTERPSVSLPSTKPYQPSGWSPSICSRLALTVNFWSRFLPSE